MNVRTLVDRGRDGGVWWTLDWLHPRAGSWRFSPLPTIERDTHGPEREVQAHWLLWGVRLWWIPGFTRR